MRKTHWNVFTEACLQIVNGRFYAKVWVMSLGMTRTFLLSQCWNEVSRAEAMPGKRSVVSDAGASYSAHPNHEVRVLYDLVSKIICSCQTAEQIFHHLIAEGEELTGSNLRDRLRSAIKGQAIIPGLTPNRRLQLQSALEFGDRLTRPLPIEGEIIDTPFLAVPIFEKLIGWGDVERFAIVVLNVKHKYLCSQVLTSGCAFETNIHPREVFGAIIRAQGTRCIVSHNHPSGDTSPSPDDIALTKDLLASSKAMNLPVLDHIIVGKGSFTSLRVTTSLWDGLDLD